MSKKTYYLARLSDTVDSWDYSDDYSRPVRFASKAAAEMKIKAIFKQTSNIASAAVVKITEEAVTRLENEYAIQ